MAETSHRSIYPAPHYEGFNPYENEGDRWLYESSRGDSSLLFMLMVKEDYHRRIAAHAELLPDKVNIRSIDQQIVRRIAELDGLDQ